MNDPNKNPDPPIKLEVSATGKPALVALPQGTTSVIRYGFWILVAGLLLISITLPLIVRGLIFDRQYSLDENARWRAIEALKNNDAERAMIETNKAIGTTIEKRYEGLITEPLVTPSYNELAKLLLEKGWRREGRLMAYKSIGFYHRMPRAMEDLTPWYLLLEDYYSADDFPRFFQVFEIMAAHSMLSTSIFFDKNPEFFNRVGIMYQNYAEMREEQYNFAGPTAWQRFQEMTHYRTLTDKAPHADMRIAIDTLRILSALSDNDVAGAANISKALLGLHRHRLEPLALEALVQKGTDAFAFSKSLDPAQWEAVGFQTMTPVAMEYLVAREIKTSSDGIVSFQQNGAGELEVSLSQAADEVYLIASGKSYLDIYPILLVSIDGGEVFPLHIDRERPEIYRIPQALAAGEHTIRIDFINDYSGTLNRTKFDRSVNFFRLIFHREIAQ